MARRVDASRFTMVPRNDVPRSAFDTQHMHKTTFNATYVTPIYIEEILPGDTVRCRMTAFARLSTPIVPVMDNLYLESFFFFTPCRLLWTHWENFMGEHTTLTESTDYQVPYVNLTDADVGVGELFDYFGITFNDIPSGAAPINALPFRAYNLIWNDWFRDQDLQEPAVVQTGDGPDVVADYFLRWRGKRHDYFTSAKPWPQKGMNQSVFQAAGGPFIPGGNMTFPQFSPIGAPVTGIGVLSSASPTVATVSVDMTGTRTVELTQHYRSDTTPFYMAREAPGEHPDVRVLINDLRTATMVQGFMEKNARGGTRYAELVRSHFGVTSPDARLQRPEYLGGGRTMVSVNPIAQTSATGVAGTTTVLGEQAGIGTVVAQHGFSGSFTEHGYIIGLVNVRADLTYQQGVHKLWKRRTQFDFYWPSLAHLGEQAILLGELYHTGDANDATVFGYQERWAEYRTKYSRTSGFFRSTNATPLDMWHYGQEFATPPALNDGFIRDSPAIDRVLQSGTNEGAQFLLDALFDVRMVRAIPMHSLPGVGARM